jgi:monothiol glutaredoxin
VSDQALDTTADPVHAFIAQTVAQNDVVLFMKGTPDSPRCGFSSLAVQILDHVGAPFVGVDVLQDDGLRDGIKAFTDWPTIPQLYVKGEFVGGSDIVREMFQAGELTALMVEKGVPLGEA